MGKFSFKELLKEEVKFDDGLRGKKIVIYGCNDTGKALVNSTILPTPNGYKRVDEIKVGDYLFGKDGKPTKVLKVFPQPEPKEVYEVCFKDGRSVLCCEDHLWEVYCGKWKKNNGYKTLTTKELLDYGIRGTSGNTNFKVDLCAPVEYTECDLPLDPYVLGCLIGDGCLVRNKLEYSSGNAELPSKIAHIMGWTYKKNSDKNYTYTFKNDSGNVVRVEDIATGLEDFICKKSHEKDIPDIYMTASIEQRMALLNGLLDTDGSVSNKGCITFSSTSEKLINKVAMLCYSLGLKARVVPESRELRTEDSHKCYNCVIVAPLGFKSKLLTESSKKERVENFFKTSKKLNKNTSNSIIDIHSLGYKEDMTCFMVDAEDHLFLANDYVVTHNTFQAAHLPKPFLIMTEAGGSAVNCPKVPCTEKWSEFKEIVNDLVKNAEEYEEDLQTVIIDTAENLVSLSEKAVCAEFGVRDLSEITGKQNGWNLARTDFSTQINRLTAQRYTVVFICHEEVTELIDEVTGEPYPFVQPKGTSNEKSSMRMLRDLSDFCIYLRPNGVDKETYETIPSTGVCKRTKNVFARSRFAIQTFIDPFTADGLIEAIENAVRKSAEMENAQIGLVAPKKSRTKEDYFELIKPYVQKLMTVCAPEVTMIVESELGEGAKVSKATDDDLVALDNIYNKLITKATLLGIEV